MSRLPKALLLGAWCGLFLCCSTVVAETIPHALLYTLDDPYPDFSFGDVVAAVGDLDGDAVSDIAVGSPYKEVNGSEAQGQVSIFSGADGKLLSTVDYPGSQRNARFGGAIAGLGDIDGDGLSDFAVGGGQFVFVYSGSNGSLRYWLRGPSISSWRSFGAAIASLGDIDGDSVNDFVVGDPENRDYVPSPDQPQGRAFVFSGANGRLLQNIGNPIPASGTAQIFGSAVSGVGDLNRDGTPDIVIGGWQQKDDGVTSGRAFAFSGRDGSLLHSFDQPVPQQSAEFAREVAAVGDLDGDSISDLVITAIGQNVLGIWRQGQAYAYSGADGTLLYVIDHPIPGSTALFGGGVGAVGDVNDDSVPDFAISAKLQHDHRGQTYIFSGFDGALLSILDDPSLWPDAFFGALPQVAPGDLDGDSNPDVVVGAGRQGVGDNHNQGQVFVFSASRASAINPAQVAKLLAGDGEEHEQFGDAVAIDGNTAVIGAPYENDGETFENNGAVYVFKRSGAAWIQQQKLLASDRTSDAFFGFSVAINGDTVVVGARNANATGTSNTGAVYVFDRSGNKWVEQVKLLASDKANGDWFGASVAIDGDTVVIGAPHDDEGGEDQNGAAYVFTHSGGVWAEQAKLLASDKARADFFGYSVSIDDDTIVVGATSSDDGGIYNNGAAYVFTRSGIVWVEQAKLLASEIKSRAEFGQSVAIEGNTIAVGSPRASDLAHRVSEHGAVYIFSRVGGNWIEQAELTASDKSEYEWFGQSVALQDDAVVIGADLDSDMAKKGAAYVFTRSDNKWTEQAKLLASDAADFDNFGGSVAMDGNFVVVGAPNDDDNGNASGSAYIFDLYSRVTVVNGWLNFEPDASSYSFTPDASGCPSGYAGQFRFIAQLSNVSSSALSGLVIRISELSRDNLVLISPGKTLHEGALMPVPQDDGYTDRLLAPGEYVDVPFAICLKTTRPFRFTVDILGQQDTAD